MTREMFEILEKYMLDCMSDSAHDAGHVYRVLGRALAIARSYPQVDFDVLAAACLLHDIGREAQYKDPSLCHAAVGGKMAFEFLIRIGWPGDKVRHVQGCISTHRFRGDAVPASLESRIIFDADKLDAAGALGIARTLMAKGEFGELLCALDGDGHVLDGNHEGEVESFFGEYDVKLKHLYDRYYTPEATRMARDLQGIASGYAEQLRSEIEEAYSEVILLRRTIG